MASAIVNRHIEPDLLIVVSQRRGVFHQVLQPLWQQGRLGDAIACQQSAMAIAQTCLHAEAPNPEIHRCYYLTMLVVDSQLSLGLYTKSYLYTPRFVGALQCVARRKVVPPRYDIELCPFGALAVEHKTL